VATLGTFERARQDLNLRPCAPEAKLHLSCSALLLPANGQKAGKFLLRREIYYDGPATAWSRKHRSWLTSVRFSDHASQATLADCLHAHDVLIARRDQVEADLSKLATSAPCAHTVARLRCLRGIDTLTALGLCAEIGEWALRSPRPTRRLPRDRPLRAHHRQPTPARVDHQSRLHPRPPADHPTSASQAVREAPTRLCIYIATSPFAKLETYRASRAGFVVPPATP
jgi:hypothetical protein